LKGDTLKKMPRIFPLPQVGEGIKNKEQRTFLLPCREKARMRVERQF
jgi:hypothetical protein